MEELITHEGIVLSTDGKMAHIQIVQSSACSACKAKAMCSSSESQAKEMDALMLEPMVPGDRAVVEVREHLAWRAVLLAYILPFVVMVHYLNDKTTYFPNHQVISCLSARCRHVHRYVCSRCQ